MELAFESRVIEWRGPAPYYFVPVPAPECDDIREVAAIATYGWGVIPVEAVIGGVAFTTSLFPKGGGYLLARDPADIYLGQIVRMFDGPLAPVPCASQTAYVRCADCRNEAECGVHLAMKQVRDATSRVLDGTSLADLRRQIAAAGPGQAVVL